MEPHRPRVARGERGEPIGGNYHRVIEPIDLGIPGLTDIERIGAGGNAVVYRARQHDLDRDVVIKVLTNVDAETTRRRFDRERRAMGRLSQAAGIAPLYGSGFTPGGEPYLLMPFYAAGTLEDRLKAHGAFGAEEVRDLGVAVANAVHTAHENGVLHRDLKPANILLRRSGAPDVADFGIAHLTDDSLGTSQALTMTPLYTAPEVFDGVESGAAGDVYSLGATLFALLNGRPAFSNDDGQASMLSLMRRINQDPLPDLPDSVPRDLVDIVAKAMSKDPRRRYATAAELAAELAAADLREPKRGRRLRAGRTKTTTVSTSTPTTSRTERRTIAATTRAATNDAVSVPVAAPESAASPKRGWLIGLAFVVLAAVGGGLTAYLLGDRDDTAEEQARPTAVFEPTPRPTSNTAGAEPTAVPPTPEPRQFDLVTAGQLADQVLVRIEAFSCTGAEVATGVVLADGVIVTDDKVLTSPWHIEVSQGSTVLSAEPQSMATDQGLSFVRVDNPNAFEPLLGNMVENDEQVAIVGIDGRPALATVIDDGTEVLAEVVNAGSGNAIEPVDVVITNGGRLAGVTNVSPGRIEIVTAEQLLNLPGQTAPEFGCPSLRRALSPEDVESAVAPEIRDLLTLQLLSDSYANEEWERVRSLEPDKRGYSDAAFVDGWRPLRQGFVYPVGHRVVNGLAEWRIGLIGHETWNGNDITTLFCVTWSVERSSGDVTQTNQDNLVIFGPRADQEQLNGFVDPGELRALIETNCPLG